MVEGHVGKMRSFGIMQGRLTPSNGRGIQFFPFDNWKKEFEIGKQIGLNEIEWIFDYDNYIENPILSKNGISEIKECIRNEEIKVKSVCFDYFMRRPFYKTKAEDRLAYRQENVEFVKRVVDGMNQIGATILEVPMVDDSSIQTPEERRLMVDFLQEVLSIAEDCGIYIGCETDMPVGVFREFLDEINHPRIKANYDSGNSSGLGYNHWDELHNLAEYVANVHIKDRVFHGTTVALGTGSANFEDVFSSLKDIDYRGSIILQAARSEDGTEMNNISNQFAFVKDLCDRYGLV